MRGIRMHPAQLTLGEWIALLERQTPSARVLLPTGASAGRLLSYRGDYADLALDEARIGEDTLLAADLAAAARRAVGTAFEGYKGGMYTAGPDTILWVSPWGQVSDLVLTGLERQFRDGMTWEAFFRGEIHIDHRLPLRMFNLGDEGEWRAAWALSNLQPMWAKENMAKAGRRELLL